MALKQITAKDFKDAVSSLTNGYTCWHKLLGRTDAGTELVFVIGWSDAGYDEEDAKKNGYADGRYTICSKIACQSRYNGSQSDYDGDFEMPYDKETGDVWDTDTMVSNNESDWEADAATYNKDAQDIWDTYCVPNEDGFTALDALFESKKSSESKKHTCSMQKKKESLAAKKNEGDSRSALIRKYASMYGVGTYVVSELLDMGYGEDELDDALNDYVHRNPKATRKPSLQSMLGFGESRCNQSKKSEGAGDTIKVTAENVMLTVNDVYVDEHGGSFSVETPEEGKSYNLLDMQEIIRGMCEDCTGYANYSRDGSEILIAVMAGEMDDSGEWTGDYYKAYSFRCTARIMSYSLEGITDFLDESN